MEYIEYNWQTPDTWAHKYLFPSVRKVIEELYLPKDILILDAGCGGGAFVNYLCYYFRKFGIFRVRNYVYND